MTDCMSKALIVHLRGRMSEAAIHKSVIAHLRTRPVPGLFFWHTPNGGYRRPIEAAVFSGFGVVPGIPDLLLLKPHWPRGCELYGLELKSAKGIVSDAQKATMAGLAAAGAT